MWTTPHSLYPKTPFPGSAMEYPTRPVLGPTQGPIFSHRQDCASSKSGTETSNSLTPSERLQRARHSLYRHILQLGKKPDPRIYGGAHEGEQPLSSTFRGSWRGRCVLKTVDVVQAVYSPPPTQERRMERPHGGEIPGWPRTELCVCHLEHGVGWNTEEEPKAFKQTNTG